MTLISSSEQSPSSLPSAVITAHTLALVGYDFANEKDVDTFLSESFVFSIDRKTLQHLAGLLNVGHAAALVLNIRHPGEAKADIDLLASGRKAMDAILYPPGI